MKKTKDFTTGSVLGSLIKFAVPVLAAMFLQSLYGGVDLLIVGQFAQTADVSGVATGSQLMHTATTVITGLSMGITVYVAQKIGERKEEEAGRAIGTGILFFIFLGIVISALLVIFTSFLADLLHAPAEAYEQTCSYITVCGYGTLFICLYNLLGAIFRGIGDSKTPLITVMIACICNIIADLVFVAGFGMGATGAAFATIIAQAISVVISLLIIRRKPLPFVFKKEFIKLQPKVLLKELKLGTPIALQDLLVGISFLVIHAVVNSIDVVASAGVGVAEKVCGFIMLVPSSFSQSMSAFVAQNIGAGKNDRALKALKYGIVTSLCVGVLICVEELSCEEVLFSAEVFSCDDSSINICDGLSELSVEEILLSFLLVVCVSDAVCSIEIVVINNILIHSVTVSTQHFDCCSIGSNPVCPTNLKILDYDKISSYTRLSIGNRYLVYGNTVRL